MSRQVSAFLPFWIAALLCGACDAHRPSGQELEVPAGTITLCARIAGDLSARNALVVVNGGPGLSSDHALSLQQLAGDELAVVTYDQRGTGCSGRPAEEAANYALLKSAQDLEAVRTAIGAEKVHLLGHSWGGLLAMQYATLYAERVDSLILVNSAPPTLAALLRGRRSLEDRILALQRQGVIPMPLPQGSAGRVAVLPAYFSDPDFDPPAELQRIKSQHNESTYRLTMSALGSYNLAAEVAGLDRPGLILWGEDDPFGRPMTEATRDALSTAQVESVVLPDCGHFWQECPDQFFASVRAFLGLPERP